MRIKTLLVEDDSVKAQKIANSLVQVEGFNSDDLDHVASINTAKENLRINSYDLLILDIALPNRIEQQVRGDAGVRLIEEIFQRGAQGAYKIPSHIIGITAHPDLLNDASQKFSERLLSVIFYDQIADDWMRRLQELVRHIIAAKNDSAAEPLTYQSFLAIVCALRTPELDAILRLPYDWSQHHQLNDDTIYYRGTTKKGENTREIYAAASSRMGMPATTALAMKMIEQFRPQYIAMAGIAAGVPGRTKFGDILVADPSFDWGSGKWVVNSGKLVFQPSAHQLPLAPTLRNKLKMMEADKLALAGLRNEWQGDLPEHVLNMKVGPIASGAAVLSDGLTMTEIINRPRDLIGIEMESYGLFVAAEEATNPKPYAFSLKSVVDFAGPKKKDNYQKYASFTSANALKHFVENYL